MKYVEEIVGAHITGHAGLLGAEPLSEMRVLVTMKDGRSCVVSGLRMSACIMTDQLQTPIKQDARA